MFDTKSDLKDLLFFSGGGAENKLQLLELYSLPDSTVNLALRNLKIPYLVTLLFTKLKMLL